MALVRYVVHDGTGLILRHGRCPENQVAIQAQPGETAAVVTIPDQTVIRDELVQLDTTTGTLVPIPGAVTELQRVRAVRLKRFRDRAQRVKDRLAGLTGAQRADLVLNHLADLNILDRLDPTPD